MLNNLERIGRLHELESVIQGEQWEDFRCYVAHLWNEKRIWMLSWRTQNNSSAIPMAMDSYVPLPDGKAKADKLLEATRNYARSLADNPGMQRSPT